MRRFRKRTRQIILAGSLFATGSGLTAEAHAESLRTVPFRDFAQQVANTQQLVAACGMNAAACDASTLPEAEQVDGSVAGSFRIDWQWLRDELGAAKTAKAAERATRMKAAQAHLAVLAGQADAGEANSPGDFLRARKTADAVLARPEFRTSVEGPTWTERQLARMQDWLLRLFSGMDKIGRRAPWLAPLIEWSCFTVAVAGLLWFVRQNLARQALRIALSEGAALTGRGERDTADWARMAEERAATQDWREAIHCLYWAAIALLESRRAWRPNVTRTPREYVRLLKSGSEAHRALRELTSGFERVWYGHATAEEAQYGAALASFRALEATKPERAAAEPASAPGAPAMGGA